MPILGCLLKTTPTSSTCHFLPSALRAPGQPYLDFQNSTGQSDTEGNVHGHSSQHLQYSNTISSKFNHSTTAVSKFVVTDSSTSTTTKNHGFKGNSTELLSRTHKLKSISDTKLHWLPPDSRNNQNHHQSVWHGLASHLVNFPKIVKSRLNKRPHGKNSLDIATHKDYFPLPMDTPLDSEDDNYYEDDAGDSRDLLDETDLRKSTSCSMQ